MFYQMLNGCLQARLRLAVAAAEGSLAQAEVVATQNAAQLAAAEAAARAEAVQQASAAKIQVDSQHSFLFFFLFSPYLIPLFDLCVCVHFNTVL